MPNINKVIIAGHLGRDAEFTTTTSGFDIGRCSVAVSTRVKKLGDWTNQTEWFRVVLLGERYTKIRDRLTKGAAVFVEGRLQTRTWDDKDGQKRSVVEVVADTLQLLGGGAGPRRDDSPRRAVEDPSPSAPSPAVDEDDDLPF